MQDMQNIHRDSSRISLFITFLVQDALTSAGNVERAGLG